VEDEITGRLGLGPIDQVGYVVEDIDAALPLYEAIFGRFDLSEAPLSDCTFRGRSQDCHLKLAINSSGPVEVELIQVLQGETPHSEHLRAHGEGLHHVRFRTSALDEALERLAKEGFATIWYKRLGPDLAFAYVEVPAELGRSVIELLEMP
jgi:catechol 2,3-dioxygenase-like lactoylglutathione lyase family enzyme